MTGGYVYRLIRPTFDLWEPNGVRPNPRAFRPDPDGLSTVIPTPKSLAKMDNDKWREWATYRIDVARLVEVPQLRPEQQRRGKAPVVRKIEAFLEFDPDEWEEDHVSIKNISKGLHEWVRDLAEEVRPPGELRHWVVEPR